MSGETPFCLCGPHEPNITLTEFAIGKPTAARVVESRTFGNIQFGQSQGLPDCSWDGEYRYSSTCTTKGGHTVTYTFENAWIVKRNKVCIRAELLLEQGLSKLTIGDSDDFKIAFLQTVEDSSTQLTFMDSQSSPPSCVLTYQLSREHQFPLLDMITYSDDGKVYLDHSQRPWAPCYSQASQVDLTPDMLKEIQHDPTKAVSACISLGDIPRVTCPQKLKIMDEPASTSDHFQPTLQNYLLSEAKHEERLHSWLALYDHAKEKVWPLLMFEWTFKFGAEVKDGTSISVNTSYTPSDPEEPTVYGFGDSRLKPPPPFPHTALNKEHDYYISANDKDLFKWVGQHA